MKFAISARSLPQQADGAFRAWTDPDRQGKNRRRLWSVSYQNLFLLFDDKKSSTSSLTRDIVLLHRQMTMEISEFRNHKLKMATVYRK